jgi:hypothetical protein
MSTVCQRAPTSPRYALGHTMSGATRAACPTISTCPSRHTAVALIGGRLGPSRTTSRASTRLAPCLRSVDSCARRVRASAPCRERAAVCKAIPVRHRVHTTARQAPGYAGSTHDVADARRLPAAAAAATAAGHRPSCAGPAPCPQRRLAASSDSAITPRACRVIDSRRTPARAASRRARPRRVVVGETSPPSGTDGSTALRPAFSCARRGRADAGGPYRGRRGFRRFVHRAPARTSAECGGARSARAARRGAHRFRACRTRTAIRRSPQRRPSVRVSGSGPSTVVTARRRRGGGDTHDSFTVDEHGATASGPAGSRPSPRPAEPSRRTDRAIPSFRGRPPVAVAGERHPIRRAPPGSAG